MTDIAASKRYSGPFTAAAGQTVFPADFPCFDDEAIFIRRTRGAFVTELASDTDFNIIDQTDAGFSVQLLTAACAGDDLVIYSKSSTSRATAFSPNAAMLTTVYEQDQTEQQVLVQEAHRDAARAFKLPIGEQPDDLPGPASRAGLIWAFDADGKLILVPGIANQPVLQDLNQARVYFETNINAQPRLMFDLDGLGDILIPGGVNPGGFGPARMALQVKTQPGDNSGAQVWMSTVFDPWTDGTKPQQKRSNYTWAISTLTRRSGAAFDNNPRLPDTRPRDPVTGAVLVDPDTGVAYVDTRPAVIFPQEAGPLSLQAVIDTGVVNGKAEGIVCFAKESPRYDKLGVDHGAPGQGKCTNQFGIVKYTQGPAPDDKNQFADDESANGPDGPSDPTLGDAVGTAQLGAAIRVNCAGLWRGWSMGLAGGKAGSFNGWCVPRAKHIGNTWEYAADPNNPFGGETVDQDLDGVDGLAGVRGGRAFWYQDAWAVYAKTGCDGWMCIGWDGIPEDGTGFDGAARAPLDIVAPGYDGPLLMFNGAPVDLTGGGGGADTGDTGFPPADPVKPTLQRIVTTDAAGNVLVLVRAELPTPNVETDLEGYIAALSRDNGVTYETFVTESPSHIWPVAVDDVCVAKFKAVNVVGRKSGFGPASDPLTITGGTTAPLTTIAGGSVTPDGKKMILAWTSLPADHGFAGGNIYFNTIADPSTATPTGLITTRRQLKIVDHTVRTPGTICYYYFAAFDKWGNESAVRTLIGSGAYRLVDLASDVTNKSLANVDVAANTKLSGVATGATKSVIYRQTTAPTGGTYSTNDTWVDTSVSPRQHSNWNGSAWELIGRATTLGAQLPDLKALAFQAPANLSALTATNSSGGAVTVAVGVDTPNQSFKITGAFTVSFSGGGDGDAFDIDSHPNSSAGLTLNIASPVTRPAGLESVCVKQSGAWSERRLRVLADPVSLLINPNCVPFGRSHFSDNAAHTVTAGVDGQYIRIDGAETASHNLNLALGATTQPGYPFYISYAAGGGFTRVVKDNASGATLATLVAGQGCICRSTSVGFEFSPV